MPNMVSNGTPADMEFRKDYLTAKAPVPGNHVAWRFLMILRVPECPRTGNIRTENLTIEFLNVHDLKIILNGKHKKQIIPDRETKICPQTKNMPERFQASD